MEMKEVKYKCDLCKEERKRTYGDDASKHEIFEMHWGWSGANNKEQYHVQPVRDTCDRHICKSCILAIIETAPTGITLPSKSPNK